MSNFSFSNIGLENGESFRMPKGTIQLEILTKNILFDDDKNFVIFEFFTGYHIFILEITNDNIINFIHSSASTGSRHAKIDLTQIISAENLHIYCIWENDKITLQVFSTAPKSQHLTTTAKNSELEYRIFENKIIFYKSEYQLLDLRMKSGNHSLEPFAFSLWNNIKGALTILRDHKKEGDYLYEELQSNLAITAIVTGFENYCKQRFIELYEEGVKVNLELLLTKMVSYEERERFRTLLNNKETDNNSVFYEIFQRINFQNLKKCNEAFKYGYNIKFFELSFSSADFGKLKSLIDFRHKVVHISPIVNFQYENDSISEQMLTPKELLSDSLMLFDNFINILHLETLQFGNSQPPQNI